MLKAWKEFRRGKRKKIDVALFETHLEDNILELRELLVNKTYKPDKYTSFFVCDPKRRHIHKASVRDRLLFQAVFRVLYNIFDPTFIHTSYSSRIGKGTHAGVMKFEKYARRVSVNFTQNSFVLKCDIKKFFDSINHTVLLGLIKRKIMDQDALCLIEKIIDSFSVMQGKGLPLGNVTSQLFANVYLNELDQFVKHVLGAKYYIRYCDDFVILHRDVEFLKKALQSIAIFLGDKLFMNLHEHKISIRKISQGTDFLGYVSLPNYRVLRTKTKKRMLRKIENLKSLLEKNKITEVFFKNSLASYIGILKHCRGFNIEERIAKMMYL